MKYTARIDDRIFQIEIIENEKGLQLRLDGEVVRFDLAGSVDSSSISILVDNRSFEAEVSRNTDSYEVFLEGKNFKCYLEDERTARLKSMVGNRAETGKEKELKSPMPGLVVTVQVKAGDQIKPGQGLVIVEAMKM